MAEYNCSLLSDGETSSGSHKRTQDQTALYTQLVISIALGLSAFLAFCVRRRPSLLARQTQTEFL